MVESVKLRFSLLLLLVLPCLGCINFRYPAPANDPLTNPVKVVEVPDNQSLLLEDGRRIRLEVYVPDLRRWIEGSDNWVEIGAGRIVEGGEFEAEAFIKRSDTFVCGTPYVGLIRIPLFPDRIIHYERMSLNLAGPR